MFVLKECYPFFKGLSMARKLQRNTVLANNEILNANFTSESICVGAETHIGISLIFTGNAVGTFVIQCSNDEIHWDDLSFSQGAIELSGSNGNHSISVTDFVFNHVRVAYNHTSGQSNLIIIVSAKG